MFQLAREYQIPVIVTATSHLEIVQTWQADRHFYLDNDATNLIPLPELSPGVTLFSGPKNSRSVAGLETASIGQAIFLADRARAPLLIEADGSRRHPLKAPAAHEPPIPDFVDTVVVVAGLSALGKPFTAELVHRPEIYARLSGLQEKGEISTEAMARVLCHPFGGLKNIPAHARRVALLNRVDTPELEVLARELAGKLSPIYHSIVVTSFLTKISSC